MQYDESKYEMRKTFGICGLPDLVWQKSDQGAFGRIVHGRPVDGPILDLAADAGQWLELTQGRGVVVQAGGCMGMYPLYYSSIFKDVHTFEPDVDNYYCLERNCDKPNIHHERVGLGSTDCEMKLVRINPVNAGMHRVASAENIKNNSHPIPEELISTIQVKPIDSLNLEKCDLIHLDVELFELEALIGAEETIDRCSPVIVVETGGRPSPADGFLYSKGYRMAKQLRMDTIYVKEGT